MCMCAVMCMVMHALDALDRCVVASCKWSMHVFPIKPSVVPCLLVTRDLYVCVRASVQVSNVCECVHALWAALVARNCMHASSS